MAKESQLERMFFYYLNRLADDLPPVVREYRFHPTRRWRLDAAWPGYKIAAEVDGGEYAPRGGRHNTNKDREKMNAAAAAGWHVLRFSGSMIRNDPVGCIKAVREAFEFSQANNPKLKMEQIYSEAHRQYRQAQDLKIKAYWQGKKDLARIALILLSENQDERETYRTLLNSSRRPSPLTKIEERVIE